MSEPRFLFTDANADFVACLVAGVEMDLSSRLNDNGSLEVVLRTKQPCAVKREADGSVRVYMGGQ